MIQQVNRIPIQQKVKEPAQAVQSSGDKGDFESMMQKTVNNLKIADQKQIGSAKDDGDKDSNQSADLTDEPATVTDLSVLAAMLQQSISPQATVVDAQATGNLQLPVLQVAGVSDIVAPSSTQDVSSVVGATTDSTAGVQMNNDLLGAQGTFAIANTGATSTAAPQGNVAIPSSVQTQDVVNVPLSNGMVTQASQLQSQVSPQGEVLPQTQNLPQSQNPVQVEQNASASPAQGVLEVQQQVMPISQSVVSSSQSIFEAQQNAATQAKQTVDSSVKPALDAQLGVLNTDAKTSVPVQATGYQNQNPTRFSDSFQTGNVVIKVSDSSSNVVKTTCSQVADKISVNFKAGNPEFQMDLYPQDLGKVSIKMAMQSGVLTVEILASDPKTQSMLMANTNEIKAMLQTTVSQPVQVMQPTQDKQWYQQQDQPSQSQQQQQQQQNDQNARSYLNALNGDIATDDFLTVMQQLRQQAYSL